jgi:hypothetical protein
MNQPVKLLGGAVALITAALVGGTLIGSVLAAPSGSGGASNPEAVFGDDETNGTDASAYCQVFLDTFASVLGVSTDELAPAAKAAAVAAIEAAVEAGDLSQEAADRMIEKVEAWDGDGCRWIGFKLGHWGRHSAQLSFLSGMWEAAAESLGMDTAELRQALSDATLEEVAADQGVAYTDVVAAVLAAAEEDLAAAVEAGRITQEHADATLERLETWLNEGEIGNWGDKIRPFFRGPIVPPPVDSPSDAPSSDEEAETSAA